MRLSREQKHIRKGASSRGVRWYPALYAAVVTLVVTHAAGGD
jgi:hypothetical protein